MTDKVGIFIDGAYLDKLLTKEFNSSRIDYNLLVNWMSQGKNIFRTYFYHCLPYQSNPPTTDESKRFASKQRFFYQLERLSKFEVRLGELSFRGYNQDGAPIFVQKRVDILLGVDLVLFSVKHSITHAALLTGDSDFLPAVSVAKNEGITISLFHGTAALKPHDDLWMAADERIAITQNDINNLLRQ